MMQKLGKEKYLNEMWEIVKKGADCIMELRTTEAQREIKVMEGNNYLFTQCKEKDIEVEVENQLLLEKQIFMELAKKDQMGLLLGWGG